MRIERMGDFQSMPRYSHSRGAASRGTKRYLSGDALSSSAPFGRNARKKCTPKDNLRLSTEEFRERKIDLVETGRGGDVTWHGPGQIVGYPILHFSEAERDIRKYVWNLEEVMIRTARDYEIEARRVEGLRGIWVGEEKLAAIGVRIAPMDNLAWFAFLTYAPDLTNFEVIVPCGIADKGVTSLESGQWGLGTNHQ